MEFNEIVTELDNFKDTDDFNNYASGFVTANRVNSFLETDDGKKLLQPILDKYYSKGLETWKTNNLQKLIDTEIKNRFPDADPKDQQLNELKAEIEKIRHEATHKDLTNFALKYATEKQLPTDIIDFFIGNDEESTTNNLKSFEGVINTYLQKVKEEYINQNKYNNDADKNKGSGVYTVDDLAGMTPEQINEYFKTIKK